MDILFYTVVGLIAATFGSLVGLGGGIIIVPALVYLGPYFIGESIPISTAVGTSLAVLIFTALSSTVTFFLNKNESILKAGGSFSSPAVPEPCLVPTLRNTSMPSRFSWASEYSCCLWPSCLYFGITSSRWISSGALSERIRTGKGKPFNTVTAFYRCWSSGSPSDSLPGCLASAGEPCSYRLWLFYFVILPCGYCNIHVCYFTLRSDGKHHSFCTG